MCGNQIKKDSKICLANPKLLHTDQHSSHNQNPDPRSEDACLKQVRQRLSGRVGTSGESAFWGISRAEDFMGAVALHQYEIVFPSTFFSELGAGQIFTVKECFGVGLQHFAVWSLLAD